MAFAIALGLGLAGCGSGDDGDDAARAVTTAPPASTPASTTAQASGSAPDYTTWEDFSGGAHSSQYTGLDQINKSNVTALEVVWTYPGDGAGQFTPIVVGDVMYLLSSGNVVAVDATTGNEIWSTPADGISTRGMHYWQSDDGSDRRIVYQGNGFIKEIDADTGARITSFGDNGQIDLRQAIDGGRDISNVRPLSTDNPGRIYHNLMIVPLPAQGAGYSATPGNVGAWNLLTGELQWVFHSIPHPGEFGYDTWPADAWLTHGGVHNWSEFTVDEANSLVFVPFGTARYDFFGGDREGNDLYANSLVAIDANTGQRIWHQQLVHHDLWDFDLPQAPKLLNLTIDGESIEAVAQATKHGFLFVFDRRTGEPVYPIEERAVPQSDLPGEHSSPTQPFPTVIEPFAVQRFTAEDINPYLPEEEQENLAKVLAAARNEGLFTPPSFEGSIGMPGHNGGANWSSSAVDPINGEFYVVSKNLPVMYRAQVAADDAEPGTFGDSGGIPTAEQIAARRAEAEVSMEDGVIRYNVPYEFMLIGGLTAIKPPWSHLTAYDLNTGKIKWRRADGTTPGPGFPADSGAHMPRGAPLVTAGGLLFVATASDRTLRAYDRDTGDVLWAYELPNGSEGQPASFEVDGRQYLSVNASAGKGLFPAPTIPDPPGDPVYMVFALP
jgi:quinoprotein glucose dehydrogenase